MTFVLATFALVFGDYLEIENTLQIDYIDYIESKISKSLPEQAEDAVNSF